MSGYMRKLIRSIIVACALWLPASASAKDVPTVVVLGIDGMDPILLQNFIDRGVMPNFKKMADEGWFVPLGTSIPPQSPVAWSNFITGMDPGGHGIFDFIHRDPNTYLPVFSAAEITEPEKTLTIGKWIIPMSKGQTLLLRKGVAFWQVLDEHDIPYIIFRVPANFPPAESDQRTLSGMGTPDVLGTYGIYSWYTDDAEWKDADLSGGEVYMVDTQDNVVHANLVGPVNSLHKDRPEMKVPFTVVLDRENAAAKFTVGGDEFILQPGEWSHWVRVRFPVLGWLKGVHGIVRFHLRSISPQLQIYATPINLDPTAPALPISTPSGYAADVAHHIGMYYTQGMPEDTQALASGALTDAEFVDQTENVMTERWRMLETVLDEFKQGFLFFYVSTIDQSCHALWRNVDPKHPAHTDKLKFADRFEQLYAEMDHMLEVVEQRIPDDAILIVMSDHGFAPYYKKFNLNSWLYQNGYLELIRPEEIGQHVLLSNVFWRRTKAYGAGINGLYVNLLGREGKGIVREGTQYEQLLDEISQKLLAYRDPEDGKQVITTVYKTSEVYHGDQAKNAPDLVVGYNRGYRGSDESALGTLTDSVLTPNLGTWTGDHCMDHHLVPGILLCNRRVILDDPDLKDMPTTILNFYGIEPLPQMRGRVAIEP
jgi:predicted AlkP superfamily phosphohydrolase/phosphomutase